MQTVPLSTGNAGKLNRIILIPIVLIPMVICAETTVYKSVDAYGNVTFSTEEPSNAVSTEEIAAPPMPNPKDVQHTNQEQQRLHQTYIHLKTAREQQVVKQQQQIQAAQAALERALVLRAQAQDPTDQDWQYTGHGRRFLKSSYFERIQDADTAVQAAQNAVNAAKNQ
ncbi:hypothetical protein TI04_13440 [Achromatium sp. WMS2]|nr:hypothetical protein TI04_13440 [Achromatium sp. WMS2]